MSGARFGPWRTEAARLLELVGVFGLAIAQPTFDLLGKNASLFVAWNATTPRVLFLVATVILVPPFVAYGLEVVIGLVGPRARSIAHALMLAIGVGVIVSEAAKHASQLDAGVLIAFGVVGATLALVVTLRFAPVRTWLRYLSVAPVGFGALLLFASPATTVVFDSEPAPVKVAIRAPHRVVMIVMDELPTTSLLDGLGAIDAELFPNLAALAETGTWYRNHTTAAPYTEAAVPAILTGQLPAPDQNVPVAAEHPRNLFTVLADRYRLNVHESVTRLCPRTECPARNRAVGVHPGVRGMMRDVASIWGDFADPANRAAPGFGGLGGEDTQAVLTANGFVNSLRPSATPTFDFLHVLLPHFPWHYLPTGQDYAVLPGHTNGLRGQNWANQQVADLSRVRHLLQVQATDTFIGQVVARLKTLGVYEDTLLVVTADHGVAFRGGGPIRGVTDKSVPDIAWTPLIVKAPNQRVGGVDDRAAEAVDVLPTMADHLGLGLPWRIDGRSLLGTPRSSLQARTFPLLDWSRNVVKPRRGEHLLQLDRARNFATVKSARVAAPNDFADLRVFGVGPYADLLGSVARPGAPADATVALDSPLRYLVVDHAQAKAQYAAIHGVTSLRTGRPLAVAVNGIVAGLSFTYRAPGSDQTEFWGTLVPRFFNNGRNLVQTFTIDGPPDAPVLHLLHPVSAPVAK